MENGSSLKYYRGSCHCSLFQFTLNIAPLTTVWTCSCSVCTRNGYLWIYPVEETQFVITAGNEKALHSYQFSMRGTNHLFCPECGSSIMARRRHVLPSRSLRINARMLEHFDIDQVEIKSFSGADLSPKNEPTQLASVVPMVESQLENYSGNCHCGGFRFDISIPKLESVRVCDCSNCVRNGFLWISPVHTDNFVVSKGEGSLTTYQFANKTMSYMFCPKCGTSVMAVRHLDNGKDELGVNARALKDIDLSILKEVRYDGVSGKDSLPIYQPPTTFPSLDLTSDDTKQGITLYHGNCHCKAVTYTVKTKPFPDNKVMSCNCSLCSRNSDLWIYPKKSEVSLSGAENLTDYVFLHEDSLHSFCKTCGVSVVVKVTSGDDIMPINVRTVDNIDVDKLKLKFYDGKSNKPEYKV